MDPTTKTALLVAAGALILFVGYSLGEQAGESNLRFELSRDMNYMLDRSTGRLWRLVSTNSTNSDDAAWVVQAEPPKVR